MLIRVTVATFKIHGYELRAVWTHGGWFFTCPTFPHIAQDFDGAESFDAAVAEFVRFARARGIEELVASYSAEADQCR